MTTDTSDYRVALSGSGRAFPMPASVDRDERLTADDRLVWAAMALTCDERGCPWSRPNEAMTRKHRPLPRVTYRVLADRCGWHGGDEVLRVRHSVVGLIELGHVEDLRAGRYRLPWIPENAPVLVRDGLWAAETGGWSDIASAVGSEQWSSLGGSR